MAETQINAVQQGFPKPTPQDGTQPRVLLPSPLTLTREREDRLLDYLKKEHANLVAELGAYDYRGGVHLWLPQVQQQAAQTGNYTMPFFAARWLARMIYQQRVEWRKSFEPTSIWAFSNFHLPLTTRIVTQQIARAIEHFFGTSPWLQADAVGVEDKALADKVDAWANHEADNADLDAVLRDGVSMAFVEGEAVVKIANEQRIQVYQTVTEIAIIPGTKTPFVAEDGDYIYRTDTFVPRPMAADPTMTPETDAARVPDGQVLKRDMKTPMPAWWDATKVFEFRKITKVNPTFEGAKAYVIPTGDFLCSRTARSIEEAPLAVHSVAMPVVSVVHRLLEHQWSKEGTKTDDRLKQIGRVAHELGTDGNTSGTTVQGTNAERPKAELGEGATSARTEPMKIFREHYVHYSVNDDGIVNSIMVVTDESGDIPIYYDYVANLTSDGTRPFRSLRVNPVPNRWHGVGQVAQFWELQQFADLLLNRINFSMMSSGRIDLVRPDLTYEGAQNPDHFHLSWGRAYNLKNNAKADEVIHSVYLQNINVEALHRLLELVVQMMTNMSGVANANDSRMAGLDTAKLATGVHNIENAGQELFGKFISELGPSIKDIVEMFLGVTVSTIKSKRAFKFFNGDMKELVELTPEELRDLNLDVTVELTKVGKQQRLEMARAQQQVQQTFVQTSAAMPMFAKYFRIAAEEQLRALGVQKPERYLPSDEELAMLMAPPAAAGAEPGTGPAAPEGARPDVNGALLDQNPARSMI